MESESTFIAWLRDRLPPHSALRLGPGDDAAVLAWATADDVVVTVDMLMDGVDFELADVDPRRAGRKALAVNLSDLAAMAAQPVAALVALALPRHGGLALAQSLYEGLLPLAERFGVALAGGDTNSWDGPLVISITAIGRPRNGRVWKRSGARPGDVLLVTGQLGGSILGKHLDFTPRVEEALALAERYEIHAAMDISDGLALDLSRLTDESRCGAVVDVTSIPIAPAAVELAAQRRDGVTPLDHALADGEDFELLLAAEPSVAERILAEQVLSGRFGVPITAIGQFVAEPRLWQRDAAGEVSRLAPRGYEHRLD
jgi:thiamine-monophosphate kinase